MLNDNIKLDFISNYSSASGMFLNYLFSRFGSYEKQFDKDCATFNKDEIMQVLKSFNSTSVETLRVKTSIIRQYANMCIEKAYESQHNYYDEIDTDALKECINNDVNDNKYISRERLIDLLKDLNNPCDQYLMLAIYDGIGSYGENLEEVFFTERTGIKDNSIILESGRFFDADPVLLDYAEKSSVQEEYENLIDNSNQKTRILLDLSCNLILNPRTNCKDTTDRLLAYNRGIRRFAKIKKYLGLDHMTIPRLQLSGFAYHIRKILKENDLTFYEAFDRADFSIIVRRYGYQNMKKARLYASIKDYLE